MFKTRGLGDSFFNNAKNCNISTARLSFIVLWMEINCKATLTNFTLIAGVMGQLEGLKESRGSRSNRAGPSSLFLLSETNLLRRTTKFLIEWPYPFRPSICCQRLCLCHCPKSKTVGLPKSQFLISNIYFSICPWTVGGERPSSKGRIYLFFKKQKVTKCRCMHSDYNTNRKIEPPNTKF